MDHHITFRFIFFQLTDKDSDGQLDPYELESLLYREVKLMYTLVDLIAHAMPLSKQTRMTWMNDNNDGGFLNVFNDLHFYDVHFTAAN